MSAPRRIVIAVVVALLGASSAVALSACGKHDVVGDNADAVNVSLTERALSPGRIRVQAGKIEFVVHNDGQRLHEFAVDTPEGPSRIEAIKSGDTARVTVDLADGKYQIYDPRGGYRARGVSGTVVVGPDATNTVTDRTVTERTVESDTVPPPPVDTAPAVTETQTQTQVQPPTPAPAPTPTQTVTRDVPTTPPPTTPTTP